MAKKTVKKTAKKKTVQTAVKKKAAAVKKSAPVKKKPEAAKKKAPPVTPKKSAASPETDNLKIYQEILNQENARTALKVLIDHLRNISNADGIHIFIRNTDGKSAHLSALFSNGQYFYNEDKKSSVTFNWDSLPENSGCFESIKIPLYRLDESDTAPLLNSEKSAGGFILKLKNDYSEGCIIGLTAKKCSDRTIKNLSNLSLIMKWILTSEHLQLTQTSDISIIQEKKKAIQELEKSRTEVANELKQEQISKQQLSSELEKSIRNHSEEKTLRENAESRISAITEDLKSVKSELESKTRAKEETDKTLNETKTNYSNLISEKENLQQLLNDVKSKNQIHADDLKEEIKKLKEENKNHISRIDSEWQNKFDAVTEEKILHEENSSELEIKIKQAEEEIAGFKDLLNQKEILIEKISKETENLSQKEHSTRTILENIKTNHARETDSLTSEYENQINKLKKSYEEQIKSLTGSIDARTNDLKNKYEEQIEALKNESRKKEEQLQADLNELQKDSIAKKESISHLESKLKNTEDTLAEKLETHRNEIIQKDDFIKNQKIEFEELVRSLENEIETEKSVKIKLENEWTALKEKKDTEIESLQKIKQENEAGIQKLQNKIEIANQNIHQLEIKIKEHLTREQNLQKTNSDLQEAEFLLKEEIDSLNKNNEDLTGHIQSLKNSEQKLISEVSSQKENIRHLEHIINDSNNEKLALKNDIARLNESLGFSKQEIEELNVELHNRKSEISEHQNRERKLNEELKSAIEREKGSKEEGRLIENIIFSLANINDFYELLSYLVNSLKERCSVDRIAIYSLIDEEKLRFEAGVSSENKLNEIKNSHLLLKDTLFGQTLAMQKVIILDDNLEISEVDLPLQDEYAAKEREANSSKSCAVLPLVIAGKTIGILTIASLNKNNFNEKNIRLYEALSPLIARTLLYNLNHQQIESNNRMLNFNLTATNFIKYRYNEMVSRFQLIHADDGIAESRKNVYEHFPENRITEEDLSGWIDTLCSIIQESITADAAANIEKKSLKMLKAVSKNSFDQIFWFLAEAADNIIKHSEASKVSFTLGHEDDILKLTITDNGEGLIRTAGSENPARGRGMTAMKDMIGICGGTFKSSKGNDGYGLEISAEWPLK